jgi:hypothetical protein
MKKILISSSQNLMKIYKVSEILKNHFKNRKGWVASKHLSAMEKGAADY